MGESPETLSFLVESSFRGVINTHSATLILSSGRYYVACLILGLGHDQERQH